MPTELVFGGQPFRLMPIIWAGTQTMGRGRLRIRGSAGAYRAAGEGEPVGGVNQPVQLGITKCVVTDQVVPLFSRSPAGHSAWRSSRPIVPVAPHVCDYQHDSVKGISKLRTRTVSLRPLAIDG
jgi:hypothetical protein